MSTNMKELLEAGVHFGHQTQRWNPKMDNYIYGDKSGIHILDLRITYDAIAEAEDFVQKIVANGGKVPSRSLTILLTSLSLIFRP